MLFWVVCQGGGLCCLGENQWAGVRGVGCWARWAVGLVTVEDDTHDAGWMLSRVLLPACLFVEGVGLLGYHNVCLRL